MLKKCRIYQWLWIFSSLLVILDDLHAAKLYENIYIDDYVPVAYQKTLLKDIESFKAFPIEKSNHNTLKQVIKSDVITSEHLLRWLQNWIRFIVSTDSFNEDERLYIKKKSEPSLFRSTEPEYFFSKITSSARNSLNQPSILLNEIMDGSQERSLLKRSVADRLLRNPSATFDHLSIVPIKLDSFFKYISGFYIADRFKKSATQLETVSALQELTDPQVKVTLLSTEETHTGADQAVPNLSTQDLTLPSQNLNERGALDSDSYSHHDLESLELNEAHHDDFYMVNYGLSKYMIHAEGSSFQLGAYFVHEGQASKIDFVSPSVGFIMLFPHIFNQKKYLQGEQRIDPLALSLFRIATLFHEAAHSRGHEKHTGFPHVQCPSQLSGHAGKLHCDTGINGGYGIKAILLEAAVDACRSLKKESEIDSTLRARFPMCFDRSSMSFLEANSKDAYSRILDQTLILPEFHDLFSKPDHDSGPKPDDIPTSKPNDEGASKSVTQSESLEN